MIEILAQIRGSKPKPFNAGLVLWDDVVIEAAPVIGYMKRQKWSRTRVREFCRRNGYQIEIIHELERPRGR